MPQKQRIWPPIAIVTTLCAAVLASAVSLYAEDARPDPGMLHNKTFAPKFDSLCGSGKTLSTGCDAIKARAIVDSSSVPWRAIGRVNFAGFQTRQHCTGTLVSERVVLTAAHCLYNDQRRAWIPPQNIVFVAGFSRGTSLANSRAVRFVLDPVEDVSSRGFRSRPAQDWALVVLETPIGRETGFVNVDQASRRDSEPSEFRLAGYSGLRPNVLSVASDCGEPSARYPAILLQKCSAMRGDSGAPLLQVRDGTYSVVGVLSSMVASPDGLASLSVPSAAFLDALSQELGKQAFLTD